MVCPQKLDERNKRVKNIESGKEFGKRMQSATRCTGSRAHDAVIRVYDKAGNVIETHEHAGKLKEW